MEMNYREIIIVGSGFSGIAMGINLRKAGIYDFAILEKAKEIGGTWRDNQYPGVECDVPSHLYSFSFAPNPDWSRFYSSQKEIFEYLQQTVKRFHLFKHIKFSHTVTKASFDDSIGQWTVFLENRREMKCRYLIMGTGGLSIPSYPKIDGLETFKGKILHTARWDHSVEIDNKVVGVIGTGASAIQLIPSIVDRVAHLAVFQRTPAWVARKPNKYFSVATKQLFGKIPFIHKMYRILIYVALEFRVLGFLNPWLMRLTGGLLKKYIRRIVDDPEKVNKLVPNYVMGCKRILLSSDYYPAMNHKNLDLITDSISKVDNKRIICSDGSSREIDVLICATGFKVAEDSIPFPVTGSNHQDLAESWKDGPEAYLGMVMHGFPNAFFIVGPNSGLGHTSIVFMIESQVRYILDALRKFMPLSNRVFQVKKNVQMEFNLALAKRFRHTVWDASHCNSWYRTDSGRIVALWPGSSLEFAFKTRRCDINDFESIEFGEKIFAH